MSASKRAYNTLATLGHLSIGAQGLSSISLAVLMLATGSALLGSRHVSVPAVVDDVVCDDYDTPCGVAVSYTYAGTAYAATFETMRATAYNPGDAITINVNPADPRSVSENLPWTSIGAGMILAAIALGVIAWYAFSLVSDNRNMAALAGTFTFLRFLVV
jgi:hypothetical protein